MKLIIGIGNPGKRYEKTRHNVGFMAIDAIIGKLVVSPHVEKKLESLVFYHHKSQTVFAKPMTFMNESGRAVKKLVNHLAIKQFSNLYVVHDDLDITLGEYKIQFGKGPKEHNGLKSIYEKLGTKDFWHVRVGIENRRKMENGKWKMENRISGEDYVLQNFNTDEEEVVGKVINEVADKLVSVVAGK